MSESVVQKPYGEDNNLSWFQLTETASGGKIVLSASELPSDFYAAVSAITVSGSGNTAVQIQPSGSNLNIYVSSNVTSGWRILYLKK